MGWKCAVCPLENCEDTQECSACGITKGSASSWVELRSTEGRLYYYDEVSKKTQWKPPPAGEPVVRFAPVPSPASSAASSRGASPKPVAVSPVSQAQATGQRAVLEADAYTRSGKEADGEGWQCGACTFFNAALHTACTMCGASQPVNDTLWACARCTLENQPLDTNCSACGADRPRHSQPQPQPKLDRQASIRRIVERRMAGDSEKRKDSTDGSHRDPLACRRCTFKNEPGSRVCDVCGLDLSSSVDLRREGSSTAGGFAQQKSAPSLRSFCFMRQESEWLGRLRETHDQLDRAGKEAFVDETFPPNMHSLYGGDEVESFGQHDTRDVQGWKRCYYTKPRSGQGKGPWMFAQPSPTMPNEPHFSPDAIQQGQLGDCWFLSALAVVCTRPELIRRLFISPVLNVRGVYALRFWHNGIWTPVLIDDNLPVTSWGGIAFAVGQGNQLWPALVEKAYAKLHGSYKAICGGTAADALTDLTGAPSTKLRLDNAGDVEMAWIQLMSSCESGFLMAASCGRDGGTREVYRNVGLIHNHAYTVLDVTDKVGVRLIKLRNPWGKDEWLGEWGDRSQVWTPRIRELLNQTAKNDGTFWMAFPDFIQYFSCVDICKSHEDWYQNSVAERFTKEAVQCGTAQFANPYTIRVTAPTWLFLSLVQRDERGAEAAYAYKDTGAVIVKVTRETPMPLDPQYFEGTAGSSSVVRRINTVEAILQPGLYVLFTFSLVNRSRDMPFTIAVWSSKEIELKKEVLKSMHPVVTAMHQLCRLEAPENGKEKPSVKVSQPFANVRVTTLSSSHGLIFFAENSAKENFQITLDCNGSVGVVATRGCLATTDTLQPGQCLIVNMLTALTQYGTWSYQIKQKCRLGNIPVSHNPPLPRVQGLHQVLYLPR